MKKIYLTLVLLLSMVASVSAATWIPSLDSLKNNQVYIVQAKSRGAWYFNPEHPDTLWGSKVAGVDASATDPNCQFAFLRSAKGYLYFYSVGGKKFIHATGDHYVYLTDTPASTQNQIVSSENTNAYRWVAQDNGFHFNLSTDQYCGLLSSWWSLSDQGNCIKITPVDDVVFDSTEVMAKINAYEQTFCIVNITYTNKFGDQVMSTYTQQKIVTNGTTISFDAPQSQFAIKCVEGKHADMVITSDLNIDVVYNYETDYSVLPFQTIASDATAFPDDTPWYYLNIGGMYATLGSDKASLMADEYNDHPIDRACMFCFSGDPINGFYIHNMATEDVKKVVYAEEADAGTVEMRDEGTNFILERNVSTGYEFNLGTNTDRTAYLGVDESGGVQTYKSGESGRTNDLTILNFTKVTDAEMEMMNKGIQTLGLDKVSPEVGNYNSNLGQVKVYFDSEIGSIKSDSEANAIKVYNKRGQLVASVYGEIDPEDATCMLINFPDSLQGTMKYNIIVPEKTIYGKDGEQAQGHTFTYNVITGVSPVTVVGRLWNKRITDRLDETPLKENPTIWNSNITEFICSEEVCPLIPFNGAEYLKCKVEVKSENEVKIYGFDGVGEANGDSISEDIDIEFDNSSEWGDFTYVDKVVKGTGDYAYWNVSSTLVDTDPEKNAGYFWIYPDTSNGGSNAHISAFDQYGYVNIAIYDWNTKKYYAFYIDFYLDDSYNDNPDPEPTAVTSVAAKTQAPAGYYTLTGQRIGKAQRGINLISKDGKVRKVLVK